MFWMFGKLTTALDTSASSFGQQESCILPSQGIGVTWDLAYSEMG